MIGELIHGQYRVVAKLGEGGMGEIWLADQIEGGPQVALKVLRARLAEQEEFVSRFRREVRATSRLQHPNIVRVSDFGKLADGRFFIAMEHADGETLEALINREGALPIGRALRILAQLADAVDHAHSRGVVHRDLKPENIMLVTRGGRSDVVKVLDFGIAKIVAVDYSESRRLSLQGLIFGTPQCMSPEQVGGVGTDPRMDLYAVGCIAFEMVTGERLFTGTNMEVMHQQLRRMPDRPSTRHPGVPREVDEVILCCLQKDPVLRFQNGLALKAAVEQLADFDAIAVPIPAIETAPHAPADTARTIEGGSHFAEVSPIEVPELARAARLCDALEARTALGDGDLALSTALTELRSLERMLRICVAEIAALDTRADEIEQAGLAREAQLGIRLGELSFERQQASARSAPVKDVDRRTEEVEAQLGEVARDVERQLHELAGRVVELADQRADLEAELRACCDAVEPSL